MENEPVATEAATAEEASTSEETTAEASKAEDEEELIHRHVPHSSEEWKRFKK